MNNLLNQINELVKESTAKEKVMMDSSDPNYTELATEAARRNGYLQCISLIYKNI